MRTNTDTRPITGLTAWGLLPALASPARALPLPAAAACPDPGVAHLDTTGVDLDYSPGHLCVQERCVPQ